MNRILPLVLLAPLLLAADAPPADQGKPTSPLGATAVKHHDDALAAAKAAYLKAQLDAEKQEIEDLDKALGVAMQAKELDEANRINAAKAEAAKRRDALTGEAKGGASSGSIDWIVGTSWKFLGQGKTLVRYPSAGAAESNVWPSRGSWTALDGNTIMQTEVTRGKTQITFSRDHKFAFWVYLDKGEVAWASRAE